MIYSKGPRLRLKLSSFYRRCRCYTCLAHPDHAAVLRRPTTSSSSGLLFNPAVTVAFYSTVICYGAMWDSRRKQDRRKSLDNAILQAEQDLSATHKKHASRLAALGMDAEDLPDFAPDAPPSDEQHQSEAMDRQEDSAWDPEHMRMSRTLLKHGDSAFTRLDDGMPSSIELSSHLRGLGKEVMELLAANRTYIPVNQLTNEPNSMYADKSARATTNFTPKKLLVTEYSVARMALYLVRSVTPRDTKERKELSKRSLKLYYHMALLAGEDAMWTQSVSRLSYPQFNPDIDVAEELVNQLNRAITSLAMTRSRGRISRGRFARLLAHRLLTSPVPPNKETYANLIKHLSRLREYGMVKIVLTCIDSSCVRYDELLIDTILVHHIRANCHGDFIHFHERMSGEHEGLMLAKQPHVTESDAPPPWKLKLAQAGKYAAYIPPDEKIWETLISGYLSFGLRYKATDLYQQMIAQGFTPGLRIINQLMKQAMQESDNRIALQCWQEAEQRYIKTRNDRIRHGSAEHHCIRTALQFCKQSGNSSLFKSIYRDALDRGLWMHSLLPRVIWRHLASDTTYSAAITRKVHVFTQRAAAYKKDFQRFSLLAFASQMLLEGQNLAYIQDKFMSMGELEALDEWQRERRAYGQYDDAWQLIKRVWMIPREEKTREVGKARLGVPTTPPAPAMQHASSAEPERKMPATLNQLSSLREPGGLERAQTDQEEEHAVQETSLVATV